MAISCPNCGVAGPNLNCNLHPMPNFGNMTNPCKEIPMSIIDEEKRWLFAEIGRLSLQLRAAELQAHTLEAKLSDLEADGIIDHMGRKLPLPGHHKECPRGQNGWAMCTCPKGRPSPLAESVTKAFQQAAADAVGTTLDRGGTAVGEVHGQWQVVSKTCEHGNTECQKCGVGQPAPTIKTP